MKGVSLETLQYVMANSFKPPAIDGTRRTWVSTSATEPITPTMFMDIVCAALVQTGNFTQVGIGTGRPRAAARHRLKKGR